MLLDYADPSSHQILIPRRNGSFTTMRTDRIGIGILAGTQLRTTRPVSWPEWNTVTAYERFKQGISALADAFVTTSLSP
jgi:hypothetical protein